MKSFVNKTEATSFITGGFIDSSADERIHRELHKSQGLPVLLFPGNDSVNLARQSPEERMAFLPTGRRVIVFVLEGTWKSA